MGFAPACRCHWPKGPHPGPPSSLLHWGSRESSRVECRPRRPIRQPLPSSTLLPSFPPWRAPSTQHHLLACAPLYALPVRSSHLRGRRHFQGPVTLAVTSLVPSTLVSSFPPNKSQANPNSPSHRPASVLLPLPTFQPSRDRCERFRFIICVSDQTDGLLTRLLS
jgi:hypothetical protein